MHALREPSAGQVERGPSKDSQNFAEDNSGLEVDTGDSVRGQQTTTLPANILPTATGSGPSLQTAKSDPNKANDQFDSVIYFQPSDYDKVYDFNTGKLQAFRYKVSPKHTAENITLKELVWETETDSDNLDESFVFGKVNAQDGPLQNVGKTSASLDFNKIINDVGYQNKYMRFAMRWENEMESGTTNSEFFMLSEDPVGRLPEVQAKNEKLKRTDIETISSQAASPTNDDSSVGTTDSPEEVPSTNDSGGGGGGGMSTGAIAGAAVGGALGGLLIISALIWFFLRRRRQKRQGGRVAALSTQQQSSNTFMVDKETHGRGDDSPASPYSEDNHNITETTRNDVAMTEVTGNHQRDIPRPSTAGSGVETPGRATNVAHLVEEGMTPDEIRRLEEEERQLDDEIERAARR